MTNDPNDPMNTVSAAITQIAHAVTGEAPDVRPPIANRGESRASFRRRCDAWERSRAVYEGLTKFAALLQPATVEATARPAQGAALCLDQARGRAAIALRDVGDMRIADGVLKHDVDRVRRIHALYLSPRGRPHDRNAALRALIRLAAIEQGDTLIQGPSVTDPRSRYAG